MDADTFIQKFTIKVLNPVIGLFIGIALIYFIWGVIEFIASGANEQKKDDGKRHMMWGIIGLTIMVCVFGIMRVITGFWESI